MTTRGVGSVGYAGNRASGGAKLISRLFNASGNIIPPQGSGWCIARCLGAGGLYGANQTGQFYGGGGGAFSKAGFAAFPSDALVATPTVGCTSTTTNSKTTVTKNGSVVCSADSGLAGVSNASGAGGKSPNGVGDVKRSGGDAIAQYVSSISGQTPNNADNGYTLPIQNSQSNYGGQSAGDNGDFDSLGIGMFGYSRIYYEQSASGENPVSMAFGAGGTGSNGAPAFYPGPGLVVLEFWSAKPY